MKTKKNIWIIIFLFMITACKKQDIMLFDREEKGIYFNENYKDSTDFSFRHKPVEMKDTVLKIKVSTMGKVMDFPRPFKVSVDTSKTNAIEGVHYTLDQNSMVIPAGKSTFFMSIKFNRTDDMQGKKINLVLKLEDNEHFKVYIHKQKNTSNYAAVGAKVNVDRYAFSVSEILQMPPAWDFVPILGIDLFGPWTLAKYQFVNSTMGWTDADWWQVGKPNSVLQLLTIYTAPTKLRMVLQALADAGTPMREDDGSLMQLGPNFRVNYSKYL